MTRMQVIQSVANHLKQVLPLLLAGALLLLPAQFVSGEGTGGPPPPPQDPLPFDPKDFGKWVKRKVPQAGRSVKKWWKGKPWVPGERWSDKRPNVLKGQKKGRVVPAPGYEWVKGDRTKERPIVVVSGPSPDLRVRWKPGSSHPEYPDVIAGFRSDMWQPLPGYRWVSHRRDLQVLWTPGWVAEHTDLRVNWAPGTPHPDHPGVEAGPKPNSWVPLRPRRNLDKPSPSSGSLSQDAWNNGGSKGDEPVEHGPEHPEATRRKSPPLSPANSSTDEPADYELKLQVLGHVVGGFGKRELDVPGIGTSDESPTFFLVHPTSGWAVSSSPPSREAPGGLTGHRSRPTALRLYKPEWVQAEGVYLIGTKATEGNGGIETVFLHADGEFKSIQTESIGAAPLFRISGIDSGLLRIVSEATGDAMRLRDETLAFESLDERFLTDFEFTLVTPVMLGEVKSRRGWTIFLKDSHEDIIFGPVEVRWSETETNVARFTSERVGILRGVDLEIRAVPDGNGAVQLALADADNLPDSDKVLARRDELWMFVPTAECDSQDSHFLWLFVVSFRGFEREWLTAVGQARAAD